MADTMLDDIAYIPPAGHVAKDRSTAKDCTTSPTVFVDIGRAIVSLERAMKTGLRCSDTEAVAALVATLDMLRETYE